MASDNVHPAARINHVREPAGCDRWIEAVRQGGRARDLLAQTVGAADGLLRGPRLPDAGVRGRRGLRAVSRREYTKLAAEDAQKILDGAATKAEAAGVQCTTAYAIASAPWEAILAAARKHKCDAIVMASHGRRGLSAVLLGSETQKVLTHTKLPVIVVR